MQQLVERIVLVTEDEIRAAVKFLLLRMKILVEPSGAAAVAAVLFQKLPPGIDRWEWCCPAATWISLISPGCNVCAAPLTKMSWFSPSARVG